MDRVLKKLRVISYFVGKFLYILAWFMFLPVITAIIYDEFDSLNIFIFTIAITFLSGYIMKKIGSKRIPSKVEAVFICSFGWVAISIFGALPFLWILKISFIDGFFETVSGFTTTGITVLSGLDTMTRSVLLWRSLIQWIGGLGILTFFLAVVSVSGGSHNLFGAESHKIDSGRPVPGLFNTVKILWLIYGGFTLLILISLKIMGLSFFDSLCHSMTTLSTGGYSTYDASIEYFRIAGYKHFIFIEYIFIFGMFLGGTNFLVHYKLFYKKWDALFKSTEMRYYFGFIFGATALILLEVFMKTKNIGFSFQSLEENFRIVLFQTLSIITTTGFGTKDINLPYFGAVARQIFLLLMVVGGCVGSTSGGVKIIRITILMKLIKRELYKIFLPKNAINYVVVDKKNISIGEVYGVSALFFLWILFLILGGLITALFTKYTGYAAFSGMFSALGNIGPCFIPVNELALLPGIVKLTYIFGMLAGRLEILPLILLFSRKAWKV